MSDIFIARCFLASTGYVVVHSVKRESNEDRGRLVQNYLVQWQQHQQTAHHSTGYELCGRNIFGKIATNCDSQQCKWRRLSKINENVSFPLAHEREGGRGRARVGILFFWVGVCRVSSMNRCVYALHRQHYEFAWTVVYEERQRNRTIFC